MAGIEFDREAFVPSNVPQAKPIGQLLMPLVAVAVLALLGLVGYKIFQVNVQKTETAAANAEIQQLEQQLAEMQRRIDTLEKHRKPIALENNAQPSPATSAIPATKPPKTIYKIATASVQPAERKPAPSTNSTVPAPANLYSRDLADEVLANREAWQATTDRLSDVVGVVGTQQGELSETRDAVNQLLAQTRRHAVSFEVGRHNEPIPVGPVTLQFKSADTKGQHYTLCVYFNSDKCIEIRDRAVNEVVVFVVAKNQPPMELVATKISHDQVVGYLQVPTAEQ
jgi:hypothetical protein